MAKDTVHSQKLLWVGGQVREGALGTPSPCSSMKPAMYMEST